MTETVRGPTNSSLRYVTRSTSGSCSSERSTAADAGIGLLAQQEGAIPVDQETRDGGEQQADEDRSESVRHRRTCQLVCPEANGRDHEADQSRSVLCEDRPQGRIRSRHHLLDQVALKSLGRRPRLPDRTEEGDPFEHERHAEHDVSDHEVRRRFGPEELLHAVGHRHRGSRHEQPERREQRPDVGLPPVTEWVRPVGRPPRPPMRDEQEDLVTRVGPGVRGFRQDRG
jgi:hypothetical protein